MNMNIRNYHARLCEKYVEHLAKADWSALWEIAEENYKSGKPHFTLGYVFSQFLASKQKQTATE